MNQTEAVNKLVEDGYRRGTVVSAIEFLEEQDELDLTSVSASNLEKIRGVAEEITAYDEERYAEMEADEWDEWIDSRIDEFSSYEEYVSWLEVERS